MSTLARRRHIPPPAGPPMAELELDRARLREIYGHDSGIEAMRREGEELIRAFRAAGVSVKEICELTGRTPQLVYQVLAKGRDDDRGGRNGTGTPGDTDG